MNDYEIIEYEKYSKKKKIKAKKYNNLVDKYNAVAKKLNECYAVLNVITETEKEPTFPKEKYTYSFHQAICDVSDYIYNKKIRLKRFVITKAKQNNALENGAESVIDNILKCSSVKICSEKLFSENIESLVREYVDDYVFGVAREQEEFEKLKNANFLNDDMLKQYISKFYICFSNGFLHLTTIIDRLRSLYDYNGISHLVTRGQVMDIADRLQSERRLSKNVLEILETYERGSKEYASYLETIRKYYIQCKEEEIETFKCRDKNCEDVLKKVVQCSDDTEYDKNTKWKSLSFPINKNFIKRYMRKNSDEWDNSDAPLDYIHSNTENYSEMVEKLKFYLYLQEKLSMIPMGRNEVNLEFMLESMKDAFKMYKSQNPDYLAIDTKPTVWDKISLTYDIRLYLIDIYGCFLSDEMPNKLNISPILYQKEQDIVKTEYYNSPHSKDYINRLLSLPINESDVLNDTNF